MKKQIKKEKTIQEWVAKSCGVSYGTFQNWIYRKILPDVQQGFDIAKALNTTVEYLITGKIDEDVPPEDLKILDKLKALNEVEKMEILNNIDFKLAHKQKSTKSPVKKGKLHQVQT
ncbi:MAG: helix-turn-helix transcriptional regulator [Spirochaetaceae bacterium]|nr:helix-turn-helix transcriptional regulator [Spirochaetaceae bacterium]